MSAQNLQTVSVDWVAFDAHGVLHIKQARDGEEPVNVECLTKPEICQRIRAVTDLPERESWGVDNQKTRECGMLSTDEIMEIVNASNMRDLMQILEEEYEFVSPDLNMSISCDDIGAVNSGNFPDNATINLTVTKSGFLKIHEKVIQ